MENRIEERHKIVREMIGFVTNYCKKRGINLWYNVEDLYTLETEVPVRELKKIKEKVIDDIQNISNCDYHGLPPAYRLEIERGVEGRIVSYSVVEDVPQYNPLFPELDFIPPEKRDDLMRVLPSLSETIPIIPEEVREEVREMEYKKMQEYAYGQD